MENPDEKVDRSTEKRVEEVTIIKGGNKVENTNTSIVESASFKSELSPSIGSTSISTNNFSELKQTTEAIKDMMSLASVLIKSKLCPLNKEEDVVTAIITGNQLGLPYMSAINNIFVVNNKPALSTHIYRALVLKAGIFFNKIHDNEPVYTFAKAEIKDGKVVPVKDSNNHPVIISKGVASEAPSVTHVRSNVPVDFITVYEFERQFHQLDGTIKTLKVKSSFSKTDAIVAGLIDKDNWKNYLGRMLDARAFTFGSREIASDITMGIYTISELADMNNIKYRMTDTFEEVLEEN